MMNASTREKLLQVVDRHEEINVLLSDPDVIVKQDQFRQLSKELSEIKPVVIGFTDYQKLNRELDEITALLEDTDSAIREMAKQELSRLEQAIHQSQEQLRKLLLPKDPNDSRNVFLEIRAGTGGDEAALFAGDLFKMYYAYAEGQHWKVEVVSASEGEHGGFKEIISRIEGQGVYSRLKFESGAHRVQRVPETESQGRIHTSACTVAVMPEAEEMDDIKINPSDLRIDTFRASGAGGQHVNKTDSAVRITYLPTGVVVECQDERSQHKNRARAMSVLKSRLLEARQQQQQQQQADTRKSLVGSGDRSERIRTYNFPQGRVTDHRINLTLYKLGDVLSGQVDQIVEPLIAEYQADLLAEFTH